MVTQPPMRTVPRFNAGDLGRDLWQASLPTWLERWKSSMVREASTSPIDRFVGSCAVGLEGLVCSATWTFSDHRLVTLCLRPNQGREGLDLLLAELGANPSALRRDGDGLFSVRSGDTLLELDRLDGVITCREAL